MGDQDGVRLPWGGGVLRPWRLQDAAALAKHGNSRAVWMNCSDRFPHPYTEADAVKWIQQNCADTGGASSGDGGGAAPPAARQPPSQLAIESASDGVIGGIGVFSRTDVQRFTKELGYWLGEDHWGRGIASAVVGVFLPYVWRAFPDTARIEALVYAYNARSCRVLDKHGFALEGRLLRAAFKDGRFTDSLVYGLLRDAPNGGCGGDDDDDEAAGGSHGGGGGAAAALASA